MTILAPCGRNLGSHNNFKLLDIVAGGKGIFPYEKIMSSDRIDIKASGNFFDRTDFFSVLKQQNVSNQDYKISYYLWNTLRIRNLSDINNFYNAQMLFIV